MKLLLLFVIIVYPWLNKNVLASEKCMQQFFSGLAGSSFNYQYYRDVEQSYVSFKIKEDCSQSSVLINDKTENKVTVQGFSDFVPLDTLQEIRKFRIHTGIGTPFLLNIGIRYMFDDKFFCEIELPFIVRQTIQNGYFAISGGIRTPQRTYSNCKVCLSGEAAITMGNSEIFFAPPAFYLGGILGGNVETELGLLAFLKIGGGYFPSGFGTGLIKVGIGWNF